MITPNVVITGATGFIGSSLARHLIDRQWRVSIIVREDSVSRVPKDIASKAHVIVDDRQDSTTEALARQIAGAELVFHLASLFLSHHKASDIPRLIDSNLCFGTRLLEAMKIAGVKKLINTGTSWQHFANDERGASRVPVNLYAATKSAFESIVAYYVSAASLQCSHLMLYDTYGPGDGRGKLVELLFKASHSGDALAMSPGDQKIDLVHIDDVVRAFETAGLRLLKESRSPIETFAVRTGHSVSLKNLVAAIETATGRKINAQFGARPYREREVMTPFEGSIAVPGWSPAVSLSQGLKGLEP